MAYAVHSRSRWAIFTAAPHRPFMFAGALQLVLTIAAWLAVLIVGGGMTVIPGMAVPGPFAHGLWMLFGVFPFFIFGFLLTAYPRWLNRPAIPYARYVRVFVPLAAGVLLFYPGAIVHTAILAAGLVVWLAGYGLGMGVLWQTYRGAGAGERLHERLVLLWVASGFVGAALSAFAAATGAWQWWPWIKLFGLWGFLVPLIVTVAHRMIPFFSSAVISGYVAFRPKGTLVVLVAGLVVHGLLAAVGYGHWTWPADLVVAGLAFYHTVRWAPIRSFADRLLAMLHVAFAWFGVAMALYAIDGIAGLLGHPAMLGRGPLHAMAVGFIASMTVAMATRVTLGHSGRALAAGPLTWVLFWGVGAAAVVRIGAELPGLDAGAWSIAAAAVWLAALVPWTARFAPMYLRPRADGKPG